MAFDWCHFWWPWSTFEGHFILGFHFHVHFSNPSHAFASHDLPAIAEFLVGVTCQLPLLREEFAIATLTFHSDLRRRAASRRVLPCPSSYLQLFLDGIGGQVFSTGGSNPLTGDNYRRVWNEQPLYTMYSTWAYGSCCESTWSTITALCQHQSPLVAPLKVSTVGSRAFTVAGLRIWNAQPEETTAAQSLMNFCRHLKPGFSDSHTVVTSSSDWSVISLYHPLTV